MCSDGSHNPATIPCLVNIANPARPVARAGGKLVSMQSIGGRWIFSASDLNNFLECRHLTELEEQVATGSLSAPKDDDGQARLLREKGEQHELAYLATLKSSYDVTEFPRAGGGLAAYEEAATRTIAAMQSGARYIYQATFFDGTFIGHADFLRRVEVESNLGAWSYEVIDTKLALSTKPYFLVQLCNYSEHLERLTGVAPKFGHIVLGNGSERSFELAQFGAYYRHLKHQFLRFVAAHEQRAQNTEYPLKRKHCEVCAFDARCKQRRRDDDHLSLVAWMRRDQLPKFATKGIATVAHLAASDLDDRPFAMNEDTFIKLRRQAHMQVRGRAEGPVFEIIKHEPHVGFGLLPKKDDGDIFFDMEGDPLFEPGIGLEYLFGAWTHDDEPFLAFWALTRAEEKKAFEDFVDFVMERREQYPAMHVYHYAPYEKSALKKLSQRHNTRENEVDILLRGEVFVDLYAVARQSLVISEDSYSIKRFEKFYNFKRETEVRKGDDSILMFESWLATKDPVILDKIRDYNRDDCKSTLLLRDWLLLRREESATVLGSVPEYRMLKDGAPPDTANQAEEVRRGELERALLAKPEDTIGYLLGCLLGYHRREEKPVWWEYHDRCENPDQLFEFDREAIAQLTFASDIPARPEKKSTIYSYRFPDQLFKMHAGDEAHDPGQKKSIGTIFSVDYDNRILELKTTRHDIEALHALIPGGPPNTSSQKGALARVASAHLENSLRASYPAIADILGATPRFAQHDGLSETVQSLQDSYLFVQGPPGTGKTTTSARVIADLLQSGSRIGITSKSHKAAQHLIDMVEREMERRGARFAGRYRPGSDASTYRSPLRQPMVESHKDYDQFTSGEYDLAGGTLFLFSREFDRRFDYLFVDEAGQVSLADAIAVATSARNVVLIGDPAQLAQVSQGSHPDGCDVSVLEHLLRDQHTVNPDQGYLLATSFRMHPEICSFISEMMYDGKLHAAPETANHRVQSPGLSGAGLRYLEIPHVGNSSNSIEEADAIVAQIELLMQGTVADDDGIARPMNTSDIIVVAPYNAQRLLIQQKLRSAGFDIAVGTVDKFQGLQAAVVFYSMATSSGDDVPRDIAFLFEQNRFNVAISRARAMTVLVCSPRLLDVACSTAEQMALVNFLGAYIEKSTLPERPGVSAAVSASAALLSG